jgi:Leucine-rich repeat (LRR) protein
MKCTSTLVCLLIIIGANSFIPARAQVTTADSLALVDLYNSTNGPGWGNHTNWLTAQPVSSWYGITVTGNRVTTVFIYNNNMTGPIPSSIGNLTALNILKLYSNHLNGSIPSSVGNLVNLSTLYLNNNGLSGAIPASVGNLVQLGEMDLSSNQLSDSIPSAIGNMVNLYSLVLSSNRLSGTIPSALTNLTNLALLTLSANQLTGNIPPAIGNLTSLFDLELSGNQFSGTIPSSIGNLTNLASLYLNNNRLHGAIPSSVGKLVNLEILYLNDNKLTGTIPKTLTQLPVLYYLYLNNNHLTQSGNIFVASGNTSVRGSINNNDFTFDGMEYIAAKYPKIRYQPQANIPIHQNGNTLSVYAGGTLSNNTYHWHMMGSTDSTLITGDSVFSPLQSGEYYVTVTNAIATALTLRSDTINFTMSSITANNRIAADVKSKARFSIYPNPATNTIHLQTTGAAIFTLTNSNGKILLTHSVNSNDVIDVSKYPNGIYYLQNNTTGKMQKIVVAH